MKRLRFSVCLTAATFVFSQFATVPIAAHMDGVMMTGRKNDGDEGGASGDCDGPPR